MYRKGDYIIYGTNGVCEICDISRSPLDPSDNRMYLALHPVHALPTSMIFTPTDNEKVVKRSPMSKAEAQELIDQIPSIPSLSVEKEKQRREVYRIAIRSADPIQLVSLIRTVLHRRSDSARIGRRLTDADTECEKIAKDNLFGELSLALGISHEETENMVSRSLAMEPA